MGDYYEINVALDGKHLFATAPRSITSQMKYEELLVLMKEKFPNSEGYQVSATKWESRGKILEVGEWNMLKEEGSKMSGIGKKIEENIQLQEFTEKVLSYAFSLATNGEFFIDDICDEMDITEEEIYWMFKQLGYDRYDESIE